MKLVRTNLYYILVVWLIVLVLLGSVLYFGYVRNKRDMQQLMINEARRLADIVTVATAVGINALEDIEFLTAFRLFDNARYVDRLYTDSLPEQQTLDRIVREHELFAVEILGSDGVTLAGSGDTGDEGYREMYAREIDDVLSGRSKGELTGFDKKRYQAGRIKGVVLPRENGGAVIVRTSIDRVSEYRQSFGLGTLGTLFNGISRDKGVRYIVLQDTLGIVVASPNIQEMTRIKSDPFLVDAYNTGWGHRILHIDNEDVLEVVSSFVTNDRDFGLLRIGLTMTAVEDIRNSTVRHFIILFTVSLVSGAFLFLYVIQRQNYMLLNTEHDRILKDVKVMEEETRRAERLASMGNLAAGVAHEIRNPLNSISLIVQQLEEEIGDGADGEHRTMLSTVGNEITRIGAIIEHFLRYARPQVLSKTETDLDTLIGDVLNIVKLRAERKNIAIVSEVRKNTVCQCDTDQIKQALVNIILNAIEAIGENGTITVRAGCVKNVCEFSVEDTGGGIDGEILARIFDPYFTTRDNGTGLGLSEVHRIVTAHDGRIRAANTDSGGAVFTIELPLGEE